MSHIAPMGRPLEGSRHVVVSGERPAASYRSAMRRIDSEKAGCAATSATRSPSRKTARPSRRLPRYSLAERMTRPSHTPWDASKGTETAGINRGDTVVFLQEED